ncbi:MAG: tRNA (adenosine(37)-N6)-dimethylallyltransferase MiaA [Holosporales bacterium]|jgi:tRNA dimethylallyltransferase|nr:tRNA (adenosine(37)-N6)-dimethylallyltransferase MiaA [Holosporales bacterium]
MFFDSKTIILLGGPTASGKSSVAVELATALDAEVVNADSVQLYEGLPILTAVPTESDMHGIPHHLYEVLPWNKNSSVADWINLFDSCIERVNSTNAFIATGGTGLYLSSLLYGLSPMPEISDAVRFYVQQQGRSIINSSGNFALYDCIAKKDPHIKGRIHPKHTQRLLRAWEVFEQTGRSIVLWQKEPRLKNMYPKSQLYVLDVDKETLGQRIDARCREMFKHGIVEEVAHFIEKTKNAISPLHKAIGFVEIKRHIEGQISLDDTISSIILAVRQYAKRQQTWFRTQYAASDVFVIPNDTPKAQASTIVRHLYAVNTELYTG